MDHSSSQSSSASNDTTTKSVHLVFQRFRKCRLLLNEDTVVHVGGGGEGGGADDDNDDDDSLLLNPLSSSSEAPAVGLLVYVSFAATADEEKVLQAATTVLNLPIVTLGSWGDGSSTKSLLQWAALMDAPQQQQQQETTPKTNAIGTAQSPSSNISPISLVLVPQANLISKVKSNGKSIQYHGQIAKARGEALYDYFCTSILDLALAHQLQCRPSQGGGKGGTPSNKNKPKKSGGDDGADPCIAPHQLFRHEPVCFKYSSWEEGTGLPLTDDQGMPVTKSAMKRIQKQYEAQVKRHDKYLLQQQQQQESTNQEELIPPTTTTTTESSAPSPPPQQQQQQQIISVKEEEATKTTVLDSKFLNVVCGTFGKRQGLSIMSDMGPFCHIVQV